MGFRVGILGGPNTGKSYSRQTIPDGENVMVLMASVKASYLKDSSGIPVDWLSIKTKHYNGWEEAKAHYKFTSTEGVLGHLYKTIEKGKMKRANLPGNLVIVKNLTDLVGWIRFIDKYMPWIHTIILPDFTHFISEIISSISFIERRHGNDAYQKFWELAGNALRGFLLTSDAIRKETIVVAEYHAEFDEAQQCYTLFTSGGKMLKEKFLPMSYYDVLLCTHTTIDENSKEGEVNGFKFVTRPTTRYKDARTMGIFQDLYIPNDLNLVLTEIRKTLALPQPVYNED
jgi:hypothetical protein